MIPVAVMLIYRCLRLMLRDVWTPSCLHHFLLEFLGTTLFLSISLSAVLIFPPAAAGKLQLDLKIENNQSNLSHLCSLSSQNISEQIAQSNMCNFCNQCNKSKLCKDSNLSNHFQLTRPSVQRPSCLQVALVFGLSIALAAFCVGGEVTLNPAVTVALTLTLKLRLWRATLYLIGQLLGGVASAALLLGLTGDVTPALNKVAPGVQLHLAFIVEILATFQLVLVILVTNSTQLPTVMSYLLVGMSVSLGHLMAVSTTGCGMNPARSFGPAVVTLDFTNQWVFWAGPSLGACLAVLLSDLLLRPRWRHPGDWWAELKDLYVMTGKQQQVALSHCA